MQLLNIDKKFYCGINLHGKTMYATVQDKAGSVLFHQNLPNSIDALREALNPFRGQVAVGVESTFNWYWLSDACRREGIPFYLGHALYMKAVHGGKNKNDKVDSRRIADLLRTNFFPMAYAYPPAMRGVRDLLRISAEPAPCFGVNRQGVSGRSAALLGAQRRLAPKDNRGAGLPSIFSAWTPPSARFYGSGGRAGRRCPRRRWAPRRPRAICPPEPGWSQPRWPPGNAPR